MSKLPTIDKERLFVDSPQGIVITREASQWLEDVVETLNYLLNFGITREKQTHDQLARLIFAINHEQSGCTKHEKCKAKLEAIL